MDSMKRKSIFLIMIVALLLSQHLLFADDDFNEFATRIYKKDIKGVEELLAKGVDVNIREKTMGSTPLIVACSLEGTYEIVELLISKGADINIQGSYDGRTALMFASSNGKLDLVKYLLSKKADVHLKAKDGTTALSLAIKDKNDEIIKILKVNGAKE